MTKLYVVDMRAFGKHVTEKVYAESREQAEQALTAKYGAFVLTARPA